MMDAGSRLFSRRDAGTGTHIEAAGQVVPGAIARIGDLQFAEGGRLNAGDGSLAFPDDKQIGQRIAVVARVDVARRQHRLHQILAGLVLSD